MALTLVRPACMQLGRVEVFVGGARPSWAPVLVREEDRHGVLCADPGFRPVHEHPVRVMTGVLDAQPEPLGAARWHGAELRCVVVDLDAEPMVKRADVETALAAALELLAQRHVTNAGFEPLGAVHGGFPPREALACLGRALAGSTGLERAWVDAPSAMAQALAGA